MKCQHCGKNEASVFVHSNINGNVEEQCLCSECAEHSGITQRFNAQRQSLMREINRFSGHLFAPDSVFSPMLSLTGMFPDNPFDDFFTDIPALGCAAAETNSPEQPEDHAAQGNNVPQAEGSSTAVQAEGNNAASTVQVQGNNAAQPTEGKFARMRRINALRHEMKQAVREENFERAAEIRDEIRRIENSPADNCA